MHLGQQDGMAKPQTPQPVQDMQMGSKTHPPPAAPAPLGHADLKNTGGKEVKVELRLLLGALVMLWQKYLFAEQNKLEASNHLGTVIASSSTECCRHRKNAHLPFWRASFYMQYGKSNKNPNQSTSLLQHQAHIHLLSLRLQSRVLLTVAAVLLLSICYGWDDDLWEVLRKSWSQPEEGTAFDFADTPGISNSSHAQILHPSFQLYKEK